MVADIARVTYDPTRQYRSLIAQQGRVTLEADGNEGTWLQSEALRLETIDIIGPTGTPNNGYAVSSGSGPGGVTVGPGIFYLGGWRLELDAAVDLSNQPDWVDAPTFTADQGDLTIALLVTEQSVGATEDLALREVALGGPDSAARSRLMQRFLRIRTDGTSCAAGAKSVLELLEADGVSIDQYSLQLLSTARLQAGFVPAPTSNDPCEPSAVGGYLGADNQLVRITVTGYDSVTKTGRLLWGWNNASMLYRATMASPTDPLTLKLSTIPVDQEHAPQSKQMVEILRTTTELGDNNFIADGQGFVTSVAQGWSSDSPEIVLAQPLPAAYQNNTDPLFVRLWQAEVDFEAGKAVQLDTTSGITVAITMTALPHRIAALPFWHFSVRPKTPQAIYPQRYLDAPQPPDGPRQWITDLAVVSAQAQGSTLLADCRIPFLPLTQQKGACCDVVMGPDDVAGAGGLQAVVDTLAGTASVLSLRTGTYKLAAPLKLSARHLGLTIEGCTNAVWLEATGTDLTPFRGGLIQLDNVRDVTLRQLSIDIPLVALDAEPAARMGTLVGMTVLSARDLTIDSCTFGSTVSSDYAFGAAIFVPGPTAGVTLTNTLFGLPRPGAELFGVMAFVVKERADAELDQWTISGNSFENLACAVLAFAQLGLVRCMENIVTGSAAGFFFAEANLGYTSYFTEEALAKEQDTGAAGRMTLGRVANAALRPDLLAGWATKLAPIASSLPATDAPSISDIAHQALSSQMKTSGSALYAKLAAPGVRADTSAPAAEANVTQAVDTTSFDAVNELAVAAELRQIKLTTALRIEDNEITLAAGTIAATLGITVILSTQEAGSVVVTGNRVVVPDTTSIACALLFPAGAVVTSNLLAQLAEGPEGSPRWPCLIVLTDSPAIMVSANLVVYSEWILPARSTAAAATTWEFLETTA